MTEKLEGSNFAKIESLNLGEGIYAYKFDKAGRPVYVLWAQWFIVWESPEKFKVEILSHVCQCIL